MTTTAATVSASSSTSSHDSPMQDNDANEISADLSVSTTAQTASSVPTNPNPQQHHHNHNHNKIQEDQHHHKSSPSTSASSSGSSSTSPPSGLSSPTNPSSPHQKASNSPLAARATSTTPPPQQSEATDQQQQNSKQKQPSSPPTTKTPTLLAEASKSSSPTSSPKQQQQQQSDEQQQLSNQQPNQQSSTNNNNTNKQQHQNANHEPKRPVNAFLLFCKKQRSLVREQYPNLENRGITKILGEWWSKLDTEQRRKYTDSARHLKEEFMKANPDFKWCKTPASNNNNNSNSNTNSNDCYAAANSRPQHQQQHNHTITNNHFNHLHHYQHSNNPDNNVQPMDIVPSNNMEPTLTNRPQIEAPKPPKKRFLERNDSIHTNNTTTPSLPTSKAPITLASSNNHNSSPNNEANSREKDGVVPYISLDQDTVDRVIEEAFSEKSSNSSPLNINMCKCPNRISTNLTTSSSLGSSPVAATITTTFSSNTTPSSYNTQPTPMGVDEPVDFSMNRTINATRQQIINNLVEKMMSEPSDNANITSRINGTDGVQSHSGPPVKRGSPDHV